MGGLVTITCMRKGCGEAISSRDLDKVVEWNKQHDDECVALREEDVKHG